MYITLLSVLVLQLHKYTADQDITLGAPIYRQKNEGDFINTVLVLRIKIEENLTFKEFLLNVGERLLEAVKHQNYPIERLLERLNIPLFDMVVLLENIHEKKYIQDFKVNMRFIFNRTDDHIEGSVEYNPALYLPTSVERIVGVFSHLLEQAIFNVDTRLLYLHILPEEEKQQILCTFNRTDAEFPHNNTIPELFEEQAQRTPHHIAIMLPFSQAQNIFVTYRQLDQLANQLAVVLKHKGVVGDSIVAIMAERSVMMIQGILGILKAGGAYLPIDPDYPEERVRLILSDSGTQILLTIQDISLSSAAPIDAASHTASGPGPHNLAYVIYTSGSTGNPKGVMIEHCSLVNRLNWMQRYYPLVPEDVILQKTPIVFDVSVWELIWWSLHGASVCLLNYGGERDPETIIEAIEKYRLSVMHFVPSMLTIFLEYLEASGDSVRLASLRRVFASGEALTEHQVRKFYDLVDGVGRTELVNLYGPTEAAIDVSYFNCSQYKKFSSIPIGKPIDNIRLYIFNKDMYLQPIGVTGELHISGVGLARGYLNVPELNMTKFVPNPLSSGVYLYKTGDLARWLPDGNIEFLGRIDNQVKIRGFRIELGEIENRLLKHEAILEAVVIVQGSGEDSALSAYIVPRRTAGDDPAAPFNSDDLREYLSLELPDYMIPSYFFQVDRIPLTQTGKMDRRALSSLGQKIDSGKEFVEPTRQIEKKVAELWGKILKQEKVGIHDNFFELGGNSLKIIQLGMQLTELLNINIQTVKLFTYPTIDAFVRYLEQEGEIDDFTEEDNEWFKSMHEARSNLKNRKRRQVEEILNE